MTRLAAFLGGTDWSDVTVDHLVLPDDMDVEALKIEYRRWYNEEYCPSIAKWQQNGFRREDSPKFKRLIEFLLEHGAREATEKEIEIFDVHQ